jgi:hypothetical protein
MAKGNYNDDLDDADDDRVWVQCESCNKWRALPPTTNTASLPDKWYCSLNIYDKQRNHCGAPEEVYNDDASAPLRSFFKLWHKKLKSAERDDKKLPVVTRGIALELLLININHYYYYFQGKKRKLDVEWIRCSNATCGKWRAVLRGLNTSQMLRKLNKRSSWYHHHHYYHYISL